MRWIFLAMTLLALPTMASASDDGIPLDTLKNIKDATVYVKVAVGEQSGSGSGFVMKVDGDVALIVTNHHVIEPKVVEISGGLGFGPRGRFGPPGLTPRLIVRTCKNAKAEVVLYSGTPQEETVPAEVLAADPEFDLAVLKIRGVKKMPQPINFFEEPTLVETMPVYTFGFPFGKILAVSKGNPAITVGKGAISSLRLDDDGELAVVQIDGSLNPGNSGGPIVDSKGHLVGVAVATISNSSGIGLAIPSKHLAMLLEGRLGKPHLTTTKDKYGQMIIHVEIGLIDPLEKIKSATLYYMSTSQVKEIGSANNTAPTRLDWSSSRRRTAMPSVPSLPRRWRWSMGFLSPS